MSNASSPTPSFLNFQLKFQMRFLIDQQFRLPGMKDTWLSKVRIFPLALSSSIVLLFEVDILHVFFFFVSLWSLALLDLALQSCLWHPPHFASGARAVQTCATIQILVAHLKTSLIQSFWGPGHKEEITTAILFGLSIPFYYILLFK